MGNKTICQQAVNRFLIKISWLRVEQNKIIHLYFANGVELAADETSLIFSEVEYMGLTICGWDKRSIATT